MFREADDRQRLSPPHLFLEWENVMHIHTVVGASTPMVPFYCGINPPKLPYRGVHPGKKRF